MKAVDGHLYFSATDLSNFLGCSHLTLLDRGLELAEIGAPRTFDDPSIEVLRRRGEEHERAYLDRLRAGGGTIAEIDDPREGADYQDRWERRAAETLEAMRAGAAVVYQAALFDGRWVGKADFLVRVERPSELGAWSYEVVDTKLAREAKGGALLQVLLYADLLAGVQGVPPEHVHLALGGPEAREVRFRVADYAAYFRSVRDRFLAHVSDGAGAALAVAPDRVAHCDICRWRTRCEEERRQVDHLSLVAGIHRRQRDALEGRGVATVAGLARFPIPPDPPLDGVSDVALERVREQARVQVRGREEGRPVHELLLPVEPGQGLAALPAPSDGDLFFDLEGDPYALTEGLEYLFGFVDARGSYTGWWALDRAAEKAAFERFVDLVMERLDRWPDLHVYHFGVYEETALKKLMGRHATREAEVDRLLRGDVLVDLHRVVKRGLRASVESYSIKKLEPHYRFERDVELRAASSALASFEAWLELGPADGVDDGGSAGDALLDAIYGYNRDDCVSTLRLRDWLEDLRDDAERATGDPVARPEPSDGELPEDVAKRHEEVARRMDALLADVPPVAESRTPEQHARWLLVQLLEFHRRENKASWWEYFRCLELGEDEFIEDRSTLGGLEYEGVVGTVKRSELHRYRFPAQEHGLRAGAKRAIDPATGENAGEVWDLHAAAGTIDLKRGTNSTVPHPRALIPHDLIPDGILRGSLLRLADSVLEHGTGDPNPHAAAMDLLLARPPRVAGERGGALEGEGETTLDAGRRLAVTLDRTVLPIQGPPGAGKTYTGARMIVRALAEGKRVGVTATSHKVISNLLTEVCAAARAEGVAVKGIQKADEEQWCGAGEIVATEKPADVPAALASGEARLAAGTAWLWAREDMAGSVDLLFVDEAGQYSLANALAVAPAAGSLVLLGDPRQLEQPQQGVHPPGADVSALDHLLRGEATVPAGRGLFLAHTYRLHPTICAFTSEIFYRGRLESHAGLERQAVRGAGPLDGNGLRLVAVEHAGNQSESVEEAEVVAGLVERALDGGKWLDDGDGERDLGLADILIVAPYNAQVKTIAERLPPGARVGTVDKFQGQQAPVVIYSMATSTPEDAPRGMQFLYSPNRLNVATSRAKCLAVVVASPALFAPECRTPEQMRLANAFCRYLELATEGG